MSMALPIAIRRIVLIRQVSSGRGSPLQEPDRVEGM